MVRGPQSLPPLLAVLACGLAVASVATAQGNAAAEGSKVARIEFIFKGPAVARGMPDFSGKLSLADVEKIKAFIQGTADAIRPR